MNMIYIYNIAAMNNIYNATSHIFHKNK